MCRHDAVHRRLATAGRWRLIPVSTSTRANQGGTHAHLQLQEKDGATVAVEDDKELVDPIDALSGQRKLTARDRDALADTISFIESGDRGLHLARKAIRESRGSGKGRRSLARATLFAPLEPAVILCSGENYWDHRAEKPVVEGKEPEFFIKLQQCANGPYDDIVLRAEDHREAGL